MTSTGRRRPQPEAAAEGSALPTAPITARAPSAGGPARTGTTRWALAAMAGMAAAGAWLAVEPVIARLSGARHREVALVGRLVTTGNCWRHIGTAIHFGAGAAFGAAFEALGGSGWKRGLAAAQAENAALWPAMAVVDRIHPDRRSGAWPRLLTDRRAIVHEVLGHAAFGIVLGLLRRGDR